MTKVFAEQPLASPRSANKKGTSIMGRNKHKRGGTERNWKKQEEKIKIKNKKNKKETKQNTPYETQHFN